MPTANANANANANDSDVERPPPTPVEEMALRIQGMVLAKGTVFTEEVLMDHLHGRTTPQMQDLVIAALRRGFDLFNGSPRPSFAKLCMLGGNFAVLERVVRAGPPDIERFAALGKPSYADPATNRMSAWLDWLCRDGAVFGGVYADLTRRRDAEHDARLDVPACAFDTVLETLVPDSVRLLRLAHELEPTHRNLVQPGQACYPVRDESTHPGNLHYALLLYALNGDTPASLVHQRAFKIAPYPLDDYPTGLAKHTVVLECLEFLRSVGDVPSLAPNLPFDALPFVTSFNLGSRYADVRRLMEAYVATGALDINKPIHRARRTFGGDLPIDAAIKAGCGGAAAALIDMGCDLDRTKVASSHCGDLVAMAQAAGRPHVTAMVTEAVMRRRMRACETAASNDDDNIRHKSAGDTETPASDTNAPARRRRLAL